jgi:hypothetical protein
MVKSIMGLLAGIVAVCPLACLPAAAQQQPVRMTALDTIYVRPDAGSHVARAARTLQQRLTATYGREWEVAEGSPAEPDGGVLCRLWSADPKGPPLVQSVLCLRNQNFHPVFWNPH